MNASFRTLVLLFFLSMASTQSTSATFEAAYIVHIKNQLSNGKNVVVSIEAIDHQTPTGYGGDSKQHILLKATIPDGAFITWPAKLKLRQPYRYVCFWHEEEDEIPQNKVDLSTENDIPTPYFYNGKGYAEEYVLSSSKISVADGHQASCLINLKNMSPHSKPVVIAIIAEGHDEENSNTFDVKGKVVLFEGTIKHRGTLSLSLKVNINEKHLQWDCSWHMENDDSISGVLNLFKYDDISGDYFFNWNNYIVNRIIQGN